MGTIGVLSAIAMINGVDLSILPAVSSRIQADFGLTDFEIGILGGAYVVVYAIAVIPFGAWADSGVRGRVVGFGVALWSLATALGAFTQNFTQLLLARGGVGFGEASYLPAGNSLVGDLYPREQRARALSYINGAFRVGISLGLLGGAALAAALGWRAAFLIAAVPGFILGAIALGIPEPDRGGAEATPETLRATGDYDWKAFRELLGTPTLRFVVVAVTFCLFVTQGAGFWLPLYVQHRFGLGLVQTGAVVGLPLLVGGLIGTFGGGWVGDRRGERSPRGHLEVTIASLLVGAASLAVVYSATSVPLLATAWFFASIFLTVWIPVLQAQILAVVIPVMRASGLTLALLVGNLFGNALAPPVIGGLSAATGSLGRALLLVVPGLAVVAAISLVPALGTVEADVRRMEERWQARLKAAFAANAQ